MPRVLLLGEDELLLRTRAAVLKTTGADILLCRPEAAMLDHGIGVVDVVVICHSVRREERQSLAVELRERWPQCRVLQIVKFQQESTLSQPHADAVAFAANPAEVTALTAALLRNPKQTSG